MAVLSVGNEPAFPYANDATPGMTLREHYIGQALAGVAARAFTNGEARAEDRAKLAVRLADEVLAILDAEADAAASRRAAERERNLAECEADAEAADYASRVGTEQEPPF